MESNLPKDIRTRMIDNRERMSCDFTGRNNIPNFGVKTNDHETVVCLSENTYRYILVRVKHGRLTENDVFEVYKTDFEEMYNEGKVKFV